MRPGQLKLVVCADWPPEVAGVKRHTVTKRLRIAEDRLDHSLGAFSAELNVALRMEELAARAMSKLAIFAAPKDHIGQTRRCPALGASLPSSKVVYPGYHIGTAKQHLR